jgi:hypothetical protein
MAGKVAVLGKIGVLIANLASKAWSFFAFHPTLGGGSAFMIDLRDSLYDNKTLVVITFYISHLDRYFRGGVYEDKILP